VSGMDAPLLDTYSRVDVTFVAGRGCALFDEEGKEYLDCLGGLAVVAAGHANERVAAAICDQAHKLVHVSNLYWTVPMVDLARRVRDITGWGRVFFANSGAEANEGAIKLARKWAGLGRSKIVCAHGGFHGRTLAALAATGQPSKWEGFDPLPGGFVHATFNDLGSFADAVDPETAAIFVEPIQGENGVIPASREFLQGLRRLANESNCLLIFDEVQTGMGRTGSWWAHQHYGVTPDLFTCAKALANGLPIGAIVADEPAASAFRPGDHASTFGGGPVPCAAALATIEVLDGQIGSVRRKGDLLCSYLRKFDHVADVRGVGLLVGAVLDAPLAAQVAAVALSHGLVVNAVAPDVVRFAPPLVITDEQIADAAQLFVLAFDEVYS